MNLKEQTFFEDNHGFMTVHHLVIQGTNHEIGSSLGELARERFGRTPAHYAADPVIARARRAYFQRNYPIHWARVEGVAAAFGVDPEDDRYDLSGLGFNLDLPLPPMGCSVVYYPPAATVSGSGYLSRNYDFSTGSLADIMQIPLPPEVKSQLVPVMSSPYVMEWYPEDGGYASIAIHAFELLSGTLDGMNSAGLVVSIMADEEAIGELGPRLEVHPGSAHVVGVHELQVMRLLLDTCATMQEAKDALLTSKQYYSFIPCHYIIADQAGNSFIYENSTGRNAQFVIEGGGKPQVVTNFQVYKHPTADQQPHGALTLENNAFWRYHTLIDRIAGHQGLFSPEDLKENNDCVNIFNLFEEISTDPSQSSIAASVQARTLWHSLYDQQGRSVEFSFYLGEESQTGGKRRERRSDYMKFVLRNVSG
jgi:hypothetical protein